MFDHTTILPVKVNSICFESRQLGLPKISDEQTLKNLKIAADEISSTSDVIGFPTETVYGLGGSAINDKSVLNIFGAKNRPSDNPLIVHISSIDQLERIIKENTVDQSRAKIPEIYLPLIEKFWPGPLSILIPIDVDLSNMENHGYRLSKFVTNNLDTVAIRFPSDLVARLLIALSDTPIAAPSANTSTKPSPTTAQHVYNDLKGKISMILDGGSCNIGLESTVINGLVNPPRLLRPGGLLVKDIKKVKGFENLITEQSPVSNIDTEPVRTPGMKYKHYSPSGEVILIFNKKNDSQLLENKDFQDKFLAGFSLTKKSYKKTAIISQPIIPQTLKEKHEGTVFRQIGNSVEEIQKNMFGLLREMDEQKVEKIVIIINQDTIDEDGLAIKNRLSKAASKCLFF